MIFDQILNQGKASTIKKNRRDNWRDLNTESKNTLNRS